MFLVYFLNIALFGSLKSHKQSIDRVWVDDTVVATRWRNFFDNLKAEWTGFTVFVSQFSFSARIRSYPRTVNSDACC